MKAGWGTVVLALLAAGCGNTSGAGVARGAGAKNFTVGPFDRVALTGPDDITVTTGSAASIRAEGDADVLERLTMQVVDGELRVGRNKGDGGVMKWKMSRARVFVTMPTLRGATLSGAGKLGIDRVAAPAFAGTISGAGDLSVGTIETRRADLRISGAGSMTIAGKSDATSIDVSGAGDVHADALTSTTLAVAMSGIGKVTTRATGKATGQVSGIGKVHVTGTEDCTISTSGVGSVTCER